MDMDSIPLDQLDVISAKHYGTNGYPHAEWKWLRENSPVHYVDQGVLNPFWAVTKYEHLVELSRQWPRVWEARMAREIKRIFG